MKKIKVCILLMSLVMLLTGCNLISSLQDYHDTDIIHYRDVDAQAFCEEVQGYFQTNNFEAIENLFSPYIKEKYDVASELKKAMEFIDGNIISYGEADGCIPTKAAENGKVTKVGFRGDIKYIKTDTGNEYLINYSYYPIYYDDKNFVGMSYISVYWEDEYTQENNYPDYAEFHIGESYRQN